VSSIQLIVGLANPGKEYAQTRHNAGAWFVEDLAQTAQIDLRADAKLHGLHGIATLHQRTCHLLVPTTFMNRSGQAVRACMDYYKFAPEAVLIVHDEIDLPAGTIRLKFDGGDGGHNGLKDIIRHLQTKQFYRLRVGVGRPPRSAAVIDYVLSNPSKADRAAINAALLKACGILPAIMKGEMQRAMQELHTITIG
jgi:peptidyl-tRNA hydrolase, PTH1 family